MPIRKTTGGFFSPRAIPNVALWLDASSPETITQDNSSNISEWRDRARSGLSAVDNNYAEQLPTYVSTGIKYVSMTDNQALVVPNFPLNTGWSVFSCMCNVTLGARWYISPYSDAGIVLMGMGHGGNKIFQDLIGGGADVTGAHIEYTSAENTNGTGAYTYYRDGTLIESNNTFNGIPSAIVNMGIGANGNFDSDRGGTYFVYEILIYNRYLGNTERKKVEGYLAQKWGLTANLPPGHPGLTQSFPLVDLQPQKITGTAYYTVFSPLSIPGCALWLDASDSSTVTGSSPITGWTEKSGNNRPITINSGPTYGTTQQHGKKTLYFSGNSITTSISTAVGTGDFTLITVWKPYSAGLFTVLSLGTSQSSSQSLGYNGSYYNFYQFGSYESQYVTSHKLAVQIGTRIASVKTVYVTGTGATPSISDIFDEQDTTVTIGNGDTFFVTGEVAEILIYTGTMSDFNRQQLESYLAQKWGITEDLPPGHSFFTNPAGSAQVDVVKPSLTLLPAIFGSVRFTYLPISPYAGNQYLSASVTAPSTDSVTYECWFYQTTQNSGNNSIMSSRTGGGGNGGVQIGINTYWGGFSLATPTFLANYGFAPSLNTWHHIALVRNGTSAWTFYYDGIAKTSNQGATFTYTNTTSTDIFIGAFTESGYPQQFTGYITNFRYVKGVAVYTGNFTVPTTALTVTQSAGTNISAITAGQTQLLLLEASNGLLTDTANNTTVTNTGMATWNALTPF